MKDYDHFTVAQLCEDSYFRDWALGRLDADDGFWEQWQEGSESRKILSGQARLLVIALHEDVGLPFTADDIQEGKRSILRQIDYQLVVTRRINFVWLRIAASLLIISGLGYWMITSRFNVNTPEISLTEAKNSARIIHRNLTLDFEVILLPDGSKVKLAKGSGLAYPDALTDSIREVYLTGEAFFDVAKDARRPFLVRTQKLTTKVLGTSFNITAYDSDPDIKIAVRTGKVTVFKQQQPNEDKQSLSCEIVLVPNQMAVFNKKQQLLIKTLVLNPLPVVKMMKQETFVFDQAPVGQVCDALQKYYGVHITYDPELMSQCSVTADLRGEPLYKQLDLMCEVLQAQYKIIDGQIVISSEGCIQQ